MELFSHQGRTHSACLRVLGKQRGTTILLAAELQVVLISPTIGGCQRTPTRDETPSNIPLSALHAVKGIIKVIRGLLTMVNPRKWRRSRLDFIRRLELLSIQWDLIQHLFLSQTRTLRPNPISKKGGS
jgi:hypothetical protein